MSLSLVPDYASSSDSDSESESKLSTAQTQQNAPPSSGLGSVLSSILPPPKNTGDVAKKRVQIVVDLPQPRSNQQPAAVGDKPVPTDLASKSGKGMFAELSSMLPAPKNARPLVKRQPAPTKSADIVECAASSPQPKSDDRALIPHSLSNKRKSKSKPVSARLEVPKQQSGDTANPDANTIEIAQIDEPFFTFAADEPSDTAHCDEPDDYEQISEPAAIDRQTSGDLQAGLVYDPTSGYYYDTRSGVYYYFDPQSGSYIDAQTLYDSAAPASSTPHAGDAQAVDELEIEKLIGRGRMRRGEANIAGTIKTVSQTSQLADSGYSDVRAGAEFSAKRALAQQRQSTRRTIAGDEVSRQKKQKHNIMYLAHQAQEQEDTLRERHANRQQAKKAAKAKYGKLLRKIPPIARELALTSPTS